MDKITKYLDRANKYKNAKQQLAKSILFVSEHYFASIINNLRHMGVDTNFIVFDEDGQQLTDEDLEKLEVQVIDFYEEDEEDN